MKETIVEIDWLETCLYFISREEKREYIFDDNIYNINKKQRDIFIWGLTNSVINYR